MSEKRQIPAGKAVFNSTTGIELAKRFEASGLGLAAFAQQEGMSKARLDYWVRKAKNQGAISSNSVVANPAASGFFVLESESGSSESGSSESGTCESGSQIAAQSSTVRGQAVLVVVPLEAHAVRLALEAIGVGGGR